MIKVPVLSKTEAILHAVSVMTEEYSDFYEAIVFDDVGELDAYFKINLPEIILLDLTDSSLGGESYLESMRNDSIYRFGGVIAVVSDEGARMTLEMEPNPCLLLSINEREFLRNSTRLFKILRQNIQFIFNRFIQTEMCIREIGTFICDNDSFDIILYTNLLVTYLANTGRVDFEGKFLLQTALMEMLLNALEHGNCCINYEDKTKWLESGRDMLELIAEKNKDPEIAARKILISYEACSDETHFSIKDEGVGFNWREMLKKDIEPNLHGMGIKMTEKMVKSLTYNEAGNEVFFSVSNANGEEFLITRDYSINDYQKDSIIKEATAPCEDIYFILRGKVALFSGRRKVCDLTAADILTGDVINGSSFGLKALTDVKIMSAKREDFLNFLKKNPVFSVLIQRITTKAYKSTKR